MRSSSRGLLLPLLPLLVVCLGRPATAQQTRDVSLPRATVIDSAALQEQPDESIAEIIATRVPGTQLVRDANGALSLRLRGEGSFYSDGRPLVVVDGVELDPAQSSLLTTINPHDVATIQVLKDPSQLSLYGIRGSNGVIVITTKRGRH